MDYLDTLPPELWNRCLSLLNPTNLRNVALTCKTLNDFAQPCLFRLLRVVVADGQYGTEEVINASRDAFVQRFVSISESTTLAPLVKRIIYADHLEMGNPMALGAVRNFKEAVPANFFPILPRFVGVVQLTLWQAGIDFEAPDMRKAIESLPLLRRLLIGGSELEDGNPMPLESFTFQDSRPLVYPNTEPLHVVDPKTIQRLTLLGPLGLNPLFVALQSTPLPALRFLHIDISPESDISTIVAMLDQCEHLLELVIGHHAQSHAGLIPRFDAGQQQILATMFAAFSEQMVNAGLPLPPGFTLPGFGPAADTESEMDKLGRTFILAPLALPNLRSLRCPYNFVRLLLPNRATLDTLNTFRGKSERKDETPIAAIEAAGINDNMRVLRLLSALPTHTLPEVFTAVARFHPALRDFTLVAHYGPQARLSQLVEQGMLVLPPLLEALEIRITSARGELSEQSIRREITEALSAQQAASTLCKVVFAIEEDDVRKVHKYVKRVGSRGEWICEA
ncbi:hypothetical protein MIND_00411700 [Mycena indigotica]|uniref:F-box domain-containing protein n=1 Tax=Mycena indigotica TaxID=2126181 RepID=A0A8H6W615_9AGAR|nr:uncharacterized protein MIND_00411700 [Mycena indigotica]KAF7306212.1 hypothetical protein MIND_00411700 [Mycena indigotica]